MDINQFMEAHVIFYTTDFADLQFDYGVTAIIYADGTTEEEAVVCKFSFVKISKEIDLKGCYKYGG